MNDEMRKTKTETDDPGTDDDSRGPAEEGDPQEPPVVPIEGKDRPVVLGRAGFAGRLVLGGRLVRIGHMS